MNTAALLGLSVLPESIMQSDWFSVLSGFVAINTILYVTLSIFKILPKVYLHDVISHHGRRAETRSIYPDGIDAPAYWAPEPDSLAAQQQLMMAEGSRGFSRRAVGQAGTLDAT